MSKKQKNAYLGLAKKKPYFYPLEQLKKHFIALGASGSGKTVLSKILIEECALHKIPSLVIDVQGDLSALALYGDKKEEQARGLDAEQFESFQSKTDITIFTPLSTKGIPLCINPLEMNASKAAEEDLIPLVNASATALTKLLGYSLTNDKGRFAEAVLYTMFNYALEKQQNIKTFSNLIDMLQQPPQELVHRLAPLIKNEHELKTLARKLTFLTIGEKRLLFQFGVPADMDLFFGKKRKDNKTTISIVYLNTLSSQEEKEFFLATLANKLYEWMLTHPSDTLQCTCMIDEIAPFLPASSEKPLTKPVLKTLFKQARKYGVGCIIATQNPGDIDYKAFAQFGTWAVGRLSLRQDIKKVEQALKSVLHRIDIHSRLPKLQPGQFLLFSPDISDRLIELRARWLYTKHITMNEKMIQKAMKDKQAAYTSLHVKIPRQKQRSKEEKKKDEAAIDEVSAHVVSFDEKKLKVDKDKALFFTSINFSEAMKIARRKRRQYFRLFGPSREELVDVRKEYHPYLLARVRVKEHLVFGTLKTKKTYNVFFDAITGQIMKANGRRHKRIKHSTLAGLCENEIMIARLLINNKEGSTVNMLAKHSGLSPQTVSRALHRLEREGYVSSTKVGTHKQWFVVDCMREQHIYKVATKHPHLETKTFRKNVKTKISEKDVRTFIKNWFDSSTVLEVQTVYMPQFLATYKFMRKTRKLLINGVTKKKTRV